MTLLVPGSVTVNDLCSVALKWAGALATGQNASAESLTDAWSQLQFMLQQWERKRWLVYQLVNYSWTATGATSFTIGPSGTVNTGTGSVRPAKIESAFVRQVAVSPNQPIDYPLDILQSREDYDKIRMKSLSSFSGYIFLDTGWPLATVYPWPIPQASQYAVHLTVLQQLPQSFATAATALNLPYEYYSAIVFNLAMRMRPKYGLGSFPGDTLPGLAKDALEAVRNANVQIARLVIPAVLQRNGIYNVFGDYSY